VPPFDSLGMVSYSTSIATMAVSIWHCFRLFCPLISDCTLIAGKNQYGHLHTLNFYFCLPHLNAVSDERTKCNLCYATFTRRIAKIVQTAAEMHTLDNDLWLMSHGLFCYGNDNFILCKSLLLQFAVCLAKNLKMPLHFCIFLKNPNIHLELD